MKTLLTPHLLGFLIERGYTYCYAKTQTITNGLVRITLTPVKETPVLITMPEGYDSYFKITREPMQMAHGIDGTDIYVSLGLENEQLISLPQKSSAIKVI